MNDPRAIDKAISWVGVNDWTTDLFEAIWPIPQGVSYNSYVVRDDEVALLDTVRDSTFETLQYKLNRVLDNGEQIDHIILNHLEPDHSSSVVRLRQLYPDATVIGSEKAINYLGEAFGISENVRAVEEGDELDLGNRTLRFHLTPMIHWPETMMTYEPESETLFSGDAFGSFAALKGGVFDDEVNIDAMEDEVLRYFANIVGKYAPMVTRALQKLGDLDISTIAPLHGPVWRSDPERIVELYRSYSSYEARPGVAVIYCSMYGNTRRMMEAVLRGLKQGGVQNIAVHDGSRSHLSYMLRDCWKYQGVIFGSPTHDTTIMPPLYPLLQELANKKLQNRVTGIFGSSGWAGGAVDTLQETAEELAWDLVEPVVEANFAPTDEQLEQCRNIGRSVAEKAGSQ